MPLESDVRNHDTEEIVVVAGARASKCVPYTMIPASALEALAARYELGAAKHGRDNWRNGIASMEYVRARLDHLVRHTYTLLDKLEGRIPWNDDDDVGAILWAGAFLAEAMKIHRPTAEQLEEKRATNVYP